MLEQSSQQQLQKSLNQGKLLTTFRLKVAVAKAEQMERIQRFKLEQLRCESAK